MLLRVVPEYGLAQTELTQAQCETIRVRLLKIGADALGTRGIEVILAVAKQFEVVQAGAAGQEAAREVEDVVALEVRGSA